MLTTEEQINKQRLYTERYRAKNPTKFAAMRKHYSSEHYHRDTEAAHKRVREWKHSNKELVAAYYKQYRKDHPEKKRKREGQSILYRFGITQEQKKALIEKQNGLCFCCGKPPSPLKRCDGWHFDHDHSCCSKEKRKTCGKCIRGLICFRCNFILGFANDDPSHLEAVIAYLRAAEDRKKCLLKDSKNTQGS